MTKENTSNPTSLSVVVAVDNAMRGRRNVMSVVSAANAFVAESDTDTVAALAKDVQTRIRLKFDDEISVAHKLQADGSVMLLLVYGHDRETQETEPKLEAPQWLN